MAVRKGPVYRCVSTVFTGSGDACARAFDAQSGVLQRVFRGHTFVINCLQVGFSLPSSLLPPGKQEASHRGTPVACSWLTAVLPVHRYTARCSTQHLMTVLCASGTYVVSSQCHLCHVGQQLSAACHASSATRWPVQPQGPYNQPEGLERRRGSEAELVLQWPVAGHVPALVTFLTVEEGKVLLALTLNQRPCYLDTSSQGKASSSHS